MFCDGYCNIHRINQYDIFNIRMQTFIAALFLLLLLLWLYGSYTGARWLRTFFDLHGRNDCMRNSDVCTVQLCIAMYCVIKNFAHSFTYLLSLSLVRSLAHTFIKQHAHCTLSNASLSLVGCNFRCVLLIKNKFQLFMRWKMKCT